jgi:hypothetical protein
VKEAAPQPLARSSGIEGNRSIDKFLDGVVLGRTIHERP